MADDQALKQSSQESQPMRSTDLQLQELLKLARACLKYERLPGEMSEHDFFTRFDAEAAQAETSRSASKDLSWMQSVQGSADSKLGELELSPPLEQAGEPVPDTQTLKSQISQIELAITEARKMVENSNAELNQEVLKRVRFDKESHSREEDFLKAQRQRQLAQDMVKRQNKEIKELHALIKELSDAPAEPSTSSVAESSGNSKVLAPPGKPKMGRPRPPTLKPGSNAQLSMNSSTASSKPDATVNTTAASVKSSTRSRVIEDSVDGVSTSAAESGLLWELQKRLPSTKQYSRVLPGRPKDSDAWKLFIP